MTDTEDAHDGLTTTSAAVERGAAVLLGADEDTARDAVAALEAAGRLDEGVAVHALVLAARKGTDAAGGLAMLAAGGEPAGQWSAFELRIAAEEAADDLAALRRPSGGSATVGQPDLPMGAARVLRSGARELVIPERTADAAPADHLAERWVEALAAAAGRDLRRSSAPPTAAAAPADAADPAPATSPSPAAPTEPPIARAADYLDVVALL